MNTKDIKPKMTVLIHPVTAKKNKRELDKIKCKVITANFIERDKITEWNSNITICK
jgi:hypothetical protein